MSEALNRPARCRSCGWRGLHAIPAGCGGAGNLTRAEALLYHRPMGPSDLADAVETAEQQRPFVGGFEAAMCDAVLTLAEIAKDAAQDAIDAERARCLAEVRRIYDGDNVHLRGPLSVLLARLDPEGESWRWQAEADRAAEEHGGKR